MLKRRIAILVAGIFIGTQAGMAADAVDQENLSAAENDQFVMAEPTQNEPASFEIVEVESPLVVAYAEPQAVIEPPIAIEPPVVTNLTVINVRGDAFPASAEDMVWKPLPAQARYLEERAARIQMVVRGDAFPPSADDVAGKLLPSQISYFDQKAARTNVAMYGSPSPDSIE
jgi:hypothetical protein